MSNNLTVIDVLSLFVFYCLICRLHVGVVPSTVVDENHAVDVDDVYAYVHFEDEEYDLSMPDGAR